VPARRLLRARSYHAEHGRESGRDAITASGSCASTSDRPSRQLRVSEAGGPCACEKSRQASAAPTEARNAGPYHPSFAPLLALPHPHLHPHSTALPLPLHADTTVLRLDHGRTQPRRSDVTCGGACPPSRPRMPCRRSVRCRHSARPPACSPQRARSAASGARAAAGWTYKSARSCVVSLISSLGPISSLTHAPRPPPTTSR
jgi:hypothetical protein